MTTAIMTCSKERLDDKIRTFSKFGDSDKRTITLVRKCIAVMDMMLNLYQR